jgi:FkbM family methyltransferase
MELMLPNETRNVMSILSQPSARLHFSQLGEDCLLWHHFCQRLHGFYVDVGCHDPYRYSNTYLLHRALGWRGINIDADPRAIEKFRRARPQDVSIHVGGGTKRGTSEFHLFEDGAVSTFDAAVASQNTVGFRLKESVMVPTCPLSEILDQALPAGTGIDYLNVDCEGLDLDVLASNDWQKYRPEMVSVEIHGLDLEEPLANPTVRLLKDKGYRMRAHYFVTTFFERLGA